MSNGLKLSIMGLYNHDDTVLDLMQFPDAFTAAQIENVKNNILIECADFEFLYPAPAVAKTIIGIWSAKEKPYWNRIYNASLLEYNPIENYRRNETETITDGRTEEHSGSDINTGSGSDTVKASGIDKNTLGGSDTVKASGIDKNTLGGSDTVKASGIDKNTLGGSDSNQASGTDSNQGSSTSTNTESGTDTVTNKITGFDSDTLVNHDSSATAYGHVVDNDASGTNTQTYGRKDTTTYGKTDQTEYGRQDQTTYGKTDQTEYGRQDKTEYGKTDQTEYGRQDQTTYGKTDTFTHGEKIEHEGSSERTVLAFGNIGVTTSQQMLTEEFEVAKIIQVANIIIESFKKRFCLMVY